MYIANGNSNEIEKYVGKGDAIVSVYAQWCGTCEMMAPILEKIGNETDIVVVKLNVDDNQEFVLQEKIIGTPTHFFYKGGKQIKRLMDYVPEQKLLEVFK